MIDTLANVQNHSDCEELYDGRSMLTLAFDLPRGSYATILIKRLTEVSSVDVGGPGSQNLGAEGTGNLNGGSVQR